LNVPNYESLCPDAPAARLAQRLDAEDSGHGKKYDKNFQVVFRAIQLLAEEEEKPKHQIGFKTKDDQ